MELVITMQFIFYTYHYESFESGYDSYHEKANRIYQLVEIILVQKIQ